MKLAIYYRVSTDKQDFDSQKHEVERYVANMAKKPDQVSVFEDHGISGTKDDRPGFQALKAAVDAGEIDAVVVYKLDRLQRNAFEAVKLIADWVDRDVQFFSVTQPIFQLGRDNPLRLTMVALFSELAQIERETIVARVNAGLAAAKARGVKLGAKPNRPYDPQDIVTMRLEGLSINKTAAYLRIDRSTVIRVMKQRA